MNDLTRANSAPAPAAANEANAMIAVIERVALNPEADIDKLERLLDMQERIMTRQAAMDFAADMAAMQTAIPSIAERGKTNNGRYATLEDIVDTVRPIMQKHGFAITFRVQTQDRAMLVTGVLLHKGGHREETSMVLPADTSGNKNAVQAFGSSVSYAKRYVLSALLNITTRGEDDDGNAAAPIKTVAPAQAAYLESLLGQATPTTLDWFAEHHGKPELVAKADYDQLCAKLKAAVAKAKEVSDANPQS